MQQNWRGFLRLLDRYLKGGGTDKEKQAMDIWYDSIQSEQEKNGSDLSEDQLKKQMWLDIRSGMYREEETQEMVLHTGWWQPGYYKIAAASVVLLVSLIFYRSYVSNHTIISGIPDSEISGLIKTSNQTAQIRQVLLSDGSRISLDPGAVLFHAEKFESGNRVVYLKGDGFFDITKDPKRPFMVYTDNIVTKVLGTSFKIRKDAKSGVLEVSVVTGKVVVEKTGESNTDAALSTRTGVLLTPNKKVTYYTESEKYVTGIVDQPVIIEKTEDFLRPDAFAFKDVPLSLVLARLEKAYGVAIEVNNEKVKACMITADLSQDDLYGKLEIICAAVNAQFEVSGDVVRLSGQGCTPK